MKGIGLQVGTKNPNKAIRLDPKDPTRVIQKNRQTGKKISKKAPKAIVVPCIKDE